MEVCRPIKQEEVPVKKLKSENSGDEFTEKESKLYSEQNKIMYKYRDQLEKNLTKNELTELLQYNDQDVPAGQDRVSVWRGLILNNVCVFRRSWIGWRML